MPSVNDVIVHCQKQIKKEPPEEKLLHYLNRLDRLKVTVQDLMDTGVGRTINQLSRHEGKVGKCAAKLVKKWKAMVSEHSESEDSQSSSSEDEENESDGPGREDRVRPVLNGTVRRDHRQRNDSNGVHEDSDEDGLRIADEAVAVKAEPASSPEAEPEPEFISLVKQEKLLPSSDESDCEAFDEVDMPVQNHYEASDGDEVPFSHERVKTERLSASESEGEDFQTQKIPTKSDADYHSNRQKEKQNDSYTSSQNSSRKHQSQTEESASSRHRSSHKEKHKTKDRSSSKLHDSAKNNHLEVKIKEERKSDSETEERSRSSGKHKEKSSKKHKDREEMHSDRHKSKEKDKERKDRKERQGHSHKNKHKEKDRDRESHDSNRKRKRDESHHMPSPEKKKSRTEAESKSLTKKPSIHIENEINSESGVKFGDLLGCLDENLNKCKDKTKEKSSSKEKPTKKISSSSSSKESSHKKESSSSRSVEKKKNKTIESVIAPTVNISPNYKPSASSMILSRSIVPPKPQNMPPLDLECNPGNYWEDQMFNSHAKDYNPEDTLSSMMSSRSQRTKVFSGRSVTYKGGVPRLFDLCMQVIQDNIGDLGYTGGVPYDILKPALERASSSQLRIIEEYNPYLIGSTDELWKFHCTKEFRGRERQEMESWRELHERCIYERDEKFSIVTKKMLKKVEVAEPVRKAKLAYVEPVGGPRFNRQKAQTIKNGMKSLKMKEEKGPRKGVGTSASVGFNNPTDASRIIEEQAVLIHPDSRAGHAPAPSVSRGESVAKVRPRKAPLMAKTMKFIKTLQRR